VIVCIAEGPSRDEVIAVHRKAGHETTEMYELPIEVT
jgi:hypothetical protein